MDIASFGLLGVWDEVQGLVPSVGTSLVISGATNASGTNM
jgi:hypothetical protein